MKVHIYIITLPYNKCEKFNLNKPILHFVNLIDLTNSTNFVST